ncbi:hypothetical protein B0H63DRAFT_458219 [Podospora didyma]|uniref:Chromo domain-containing protein n=1 Tax=Podospora didyma TaxID=330526 RepID=A0AAE0P4Y9_9PEZI|nr:hypothetical protein B0H63DRAFT_458219 [Podospora didyma]
MPRTKQSAPALSAPPKTTIAVDVLTKSPYVPNSIPVPKPSIGLSDDSTGYIISKAVFPSNRVKDQLIPWYHIGFTDDPALRAWIRSDEVLEYVSPYQLEHWEYENFKERQQEAAGEREKASRGKQKPGPKPKGRPVRMAKKPAPDAAPPTAPSEVPSLSTPQKQRLNSKRRKSQTVEGGESASNQGSDAPVRKRQRNSEIRDSEVDDDDMMVGEHPMSASIHTRDASALGPAGRMPAPASPFGAWPGPPSAATAGESSEAPKNPSKRKQAPKAPTVSPYLPAPPAKPKRSVGPTVSPYFPAPAPKPSAGPTVSPYFPTPPPLRPSVGPTVSPYLPAPAFTVPSFSTPAKPGSSSTPLVPASSQRKGSSTKASKAAKPKVEPQGDDDGDVGDDVWVVQELLADRRMTEKGVRVHKYLVQWEGDWPEDQNPTWEPAENIDAGVIRAYNKKKRAGKLKPVDAKHLAKLNPFAYTKYTSVTEAFEGDVHQPKSLYKGVIEEDSDEPDEETLLVAKGYTPSKSFASFPSF